MYEVVKMPWRNVWLVVKGDEIIDGYASADLATAYVRYMNGNA